MANSWRNLPGKVWVGLKAFDPRLRRRAEEEAGKMTPLERELFLSLTRYDLAHSLAVASRLGDEDPVLHRAALLHDVGKLRRELGITARYLYMLMEIFLPSRLRRLVQDLEGKAAGSSWSERAYSLPRGWRRGLYVQVHHGRIAGELLRQAGCEEEVCRLVEGHQEEPRDERARALAEADDSL